MHGIKMAASVGGLLFSLLCFVSLSVKNPIYWNEINVSRDILIHATRSNCYYEDGGYGTFIIYTQSSSTISRNDSKAKLVKSSHSAVLYYLLNILLLSGDIQFNPGPEGSSSPVFNFNLPKKGLNCVHLNVRSLYNKLDELRCVTERNPNIDILCVSETWLDESVTNEEIAINDFNAPFRLDRKDANGGGVLIYTKPHVKCLEREDLYDPNIEATWIEICMSQTQPILLGCVYRPPYSLSDWYVYFEKTLGKVYLSDKNA